MKTTKSHRVLLGLGVVGATTMLSALQPATAGPRDIYVPRVRDWWPQKGYQHGRIYNGKTYYDLTGRITRNYAGNGFLLLTDRGSTYRVIVAGGEPRRVSVGDRVRVAGFYSGSALRANQFRMLLNR